MDRNAALLMFGLTAAMPAPSQYSWRTSSVALITAICGRRADRAPFAQALAGELVLLVGRRPTSVPSSSWRVR